MDEVARPSPQDRIHVVFQAPADQPPSAGSVHPGLARHGEGVEAVSGGSANRLLQKVGEIDQESLSQGLASICAAVSSALAKAAPDAWEVELNVGFSAQAKVPVLMAGEGNAALKVKLSWKRPQASSTQTKEG